MRRGAQTACWALVLGLWWTGTAAAESTQELFVQGNRALLKGEPASALQRYQTLAESGARDPDLEFNLALAHAELGELGHALLHLLRAQELRPGDDEVSEAIRTTRDALGKRAAAREGEATVQTRPPLLEAMTAWLGRDTLACLLWLGAALASLAGMALLRERREGRRLAAGITLTFALLWAGFSGLGLAVKAGVFREGPRVLLVSDQVALRQGPDEHAPRQGTLAEGTRAILLEELPGRARIRTAAESGWVPRDALRLY